MHAIAELPNCGIAELKSKSHRGLDAEARRRRKVDENEFIHSSHAEQSRSIPTGKGTSRLPCSASLRQSPRCDPLHNAGSRQLLSFLFMARITTKSRDLQRRAERLMPGGVNPPVRGFRSVGGEPPFIVRGEGARMFDADEIGRASCR